MQQHEGNVEGRTVYEKKLILALTKNPEHDNIRTQLTPKTWL